MSQKKTLKQEAEDRPRWPVSSGGKHWVFLNKISDSPETGGRELIERTKPWGAGSLASVFNAPARVGRSAKSFQQAQNTAESRHTGKQGSGAGQKLHISGKREL